MASTTGRDVALTSLVAVSIIADPEVAPVQAVPAPSGPPG